MSALKLGFSYSEMMHMPYARVMWALDAWRDMNASNGKEEPSTSTATQNDIASMLY